MPTNNPQGEQQHTKGGRERKPTDGNRTGKTNPSENRGSADSNKDKQ